MGGRGILLGGLPGAPRGRVVVVGAGHAGGRAVMTAAAMGAEVTVFDKKRERLDVMHRVGANVTALYPYADALTSALAGADVLVGAVLRPGAKAPHLISRAQVASMGAGAVVADIAVDQGGCVETTRPAGWDDPFFVEEGVNHFCVTNMPGAVPRSASLALSAVLIPYVQRLARPDWREHPGLAGAVNVSDGEVVLPALLA
jgi:alanine dehydrogenase